MESAAYGCATITSNNGGLKETFKNQLILKKNSSNELYKEVDKLIKNKKILKLIQNKNFNNVLHKLKDQVLKLDNVKRFLLFDTLNFFWYKFGIFLQFLFTPIIMFLTFFLLITPISILMRIFSRKQLMNLNFKKKSNSYWIYEKADKKLNMKDPF